MSKETAVEYMFRLLDVMTPDKDDESADIWEAIYHRALEMEREQIEQAYIQGCLDEIDERMESRVEESCKRYYNDTYKGGEQ